MAPLVSAAEDRGVERRPDRLAIALVSVGPRVELMEANATFRRRIRGLEGAPFEEQLRDADSPLGRAVRSVGSSGEATVLTGLGRRGRKGTPAASMSIEVVNVSRARSDRRELLLIARGPEPEQRRFDRARLFFQAFLDSTNAMEITDRDGVIVAVNPAYERIYGYAARDLIGRRPSIVASGRTPRELYRQMWAALLDPGRGHWAGEITNRSREGRELPVLLSVTAIRDARGLPTHFLGTAVDLSERRAWQRQAARSERLASLGQLAAGVAHEINTPLANILLVTESLRRRVEDGTVRQRLDTIIAQTESASRIVRGLLDFSRKHEPVVSRVDLAAIARETTEFLRAKQSSDVEVHVQVPTTPVLLHADREQLIELVTNLLNNGYDAIHGQGDLWVRVRVDADRAVLEVSDSGPGISPDVMTHLFEPFFTTKPAGKGTGLGLAICHGIVEAHGGEIRVHSEPGHGATFEVHLPMNSEDSIAPEGTAGVLRGTGIGPANPSGVLPEGRELGGGSP